MTVEQLARHEVIPNLTRRLGDLKVQADKHLANLAATLRQIDETRDQLSEHGINMTVDLGTVGNAASHARRAEEADRADTPFHMPKAV